MVANGLIPGTWKMVGNRISIVNPIQPIDVGVIGDEATDTPVPSAMSAPAKRTNPSRESADAAKATAMATMSVAARERTCCSDSCRG